MRLLRRATEATGATAAVEFALTVPIMIALLFGGYVFGVYLGVAHSVQQLASEAARASIAGLSDTERASLARRFVTSTVASYGLLRPDALTVAAASSATDPDIFTVTLTYNTSGMGLSAFSGIVPMPTERLQRSGSVRRGGA